MREVSETNRPRKATFSRAEVWAYAVIAFAVILAFGGVLTRGIQGDDLCQCELATTRGYWDAVRFWLERWNGRLFLALIQIGSYRMTWFSSPVNAPWFILHTLFVLAHLATCFLLFGLLSRAGISSGAALAAVLVLAVHPVTFESVLWLATAYGYVLGTLLTVLAVWTYLEYERSGRRVWLALTLLLALAAAMGIEQYLVVLATLAGIQLVRSRGHMSTPRAWIALVIVVGCAAVFLAFHFGLFSSTSSRIARATLVSEPIAQPGFLWTLAWFMSLVPESSPYGGLPQVGLEALRRHVTLSVLVVLAALCAGWRATSFNALDDAPKVPSQQRHLWLIVTGMAIFMAAMSPFLFTGKYGFGKRNLYPALPGIVIVFASALDLMSRFRALRTPLRFVLAPVVAVCIAVSLVIDIGAQGILARSWSLHRGLIEAIEMDSEAIRSAGGVEVTGIPPNPYMAIAQIDNSWAFPCLVRWVVGDGEVRAWNNLMRVELRSDPSLGSHRIRWREY